MIGFLNPLFLFGLAAASIPVIIHLLHRPRAAVLEFSSLRLLVEVEKQNVKRIKLRQLILLILRTLIILMIISALARPVLRILVSADISTHQRTAVVAILDNSASMGYVASAGKVFDLSKQRLLETMDYLNKEDALSIIVANERVQLLGDEGEVDLADAEKIVGKVYSTHYSTNLSRALEQAAKLLKEKSYPAKEVWVFTDMQTGFLNGKELDLDIDEGEEIKFVFLTERTGDEYNSWVDKADLSHQLIRPNKSLNVVANIGKVAGNEKVVLFPLLKIADKVQSQGEAVLSGGEINAVLPAEGMEPGTYSGEVEIEADPLEVDNKRFFTFKVPRKFNCLLVINNDSEERYLRTALEVLSTEGGSLSLTAKTHATLNSQDVTLSDTIILAGNVPSPSKFTALTGSLIGNRALIIIPSSRSLAEEYNALLTSFNSSLRLGSFTQKNEEGYDIVKDIRFAGDVFNFGVDGEREIWQRLKIFRRFDINFEPSLLGNKKELLMTLQNGANWLAVESLGQLRIALWGSDINPADIELARSPLLIPFLDRFLEVLLGRFSGESPALRVGDNAVLGPYDEVMEGNLDVFDPAGDKFSLPITKRESTIFENTEMVGNYRVEFEGSLINRFSVNLDPSESRIGEEEGEVISAKLEPYSYDVVRSGREIEDKILTERRGREIWKEVLWLALILLVIEQLIANEIWFRNRKINLPVLEND